MVETKDVDVESIVGQEKIGDVPDFEVGHYGFIPFVIGRDLGGTNRFMASKSPCQICNKIGQDLGVFNKCFLKKGSVKKRPVYRKNAYHNITCNSFYWNWNNGMNVSCYCFLQHDIEYVIGEVVSQSFWRVESYDKSLPPALFIEIIGQQGFMRVAISEDTNIPDNVSVYIPVTLLDNKGDIEKVSGA